MLAIKCLCSTGHPGEGAHIPEAIIELDAVAVMSNAEVQRLNIEATCELCVSCFPIRASLTMLDRASLPFVNVVDSKAAPLVKEGATACEAPSQVAAAADVIFTIVG